MRCILLATTLIAAPGLAFAQSTPEPEPQDVDEVVVTGERNYLRPSIVTASKTDTAQLELPISVAAVTRPLLDDQQAFRAADGLKNIASFQNGYSYGPIEDSFYLRGFSTGDHFGAAAYRDGVRIASFNIPTAGLEAIEVLKGPASALYGRAEPGGVINFVTKKASWSRLANLEAQLGSEDFTRFTGDFGGPVGDGFAVRLVGDHADTGSFRDFVEQQQTYVLGAVAWRPTDRTRIELQAEYRDQETVDDLGLPIVNGRPADIPLSRYLGEPGVGAAVREDHVVDLDIEHDLSDHFIVRAKAYYSAFDQSFLNVSFGPLDAATGELSRVFFADDNLNEVVYGMVELAGQLGAGPVTHDLLVGVDRYETTLSEQIWYNFTDPTAIRPINIYNPVYGGSRRPNLDPALAEAYDADNSWTGLYAQDLIRVGDRWRILAGLRHDRASVSSTGSDEVEESQTSGRLGVVYLAGPGLSLYASAANGFGRANGRRGNGEPQPPEESEHLEIGLKYAPFGDRLIASIAAYDITKRNVGTADLSTPDPFDSLAIGEVVSRGLDFDVAGWLTSRWSVQASYAWNDLEVTRDEGGLTGNRLQNAPEHAIAVWNRYDFSRTFTAGLGVYSMGERPGDDQNTWVLPGYTRVDLMGQYRVTVGGRDLILTANVNNLFDEAWFASGSDFYLAAAPGEPRTVRIGLRVRL